MSKIVEEVNRHTIAVLVDNEAGVLARVIGLFSGRGYNIESLTVDEVDSAANLSRITIVSRGTQVILDQIAAQLGRLMPVRKVVNLTEQGRSIECVVALIKIVGNAAMRAKATAIAENAAARVVDTTGDAMVVQMCGEPGVVDRVIDQLRPCGLTEIARSGSLAIGCGDAVLEATAAARQSA